MRAGERTWPASWPAWRTPPPRAPPSQQHASSLYSGRPSPACCRATGSVDCALESRKLLHGGLPRHNEMAAQSGLSCDNGHTSKSAWAAPWSNRFPVQPLLLQGAHVTEPANNFFKCACAGWRTRPWTRWGASTQLPRPGARRSPAHPPCCTPTTRWGLSPTLIVMLPKAALLLASLLRAEKSHAIATPGT